MVAKLSRLNWIMISAKRLCREYAFPNVSSWGSTQPHTLSRFKFFEEKHDLEHKKHKRSIYYVVDPTGKSKSFCQKLYLKIVVELVIAIYLSYTHHNDFLSPYFLSKRASLSVQKLKPNSPTKLYISAPHGPCLFFY